MKGRCRKVISDIKVFTNNAEHNSLASPFISGFLKSNPFLKNTYNIHGYVFVNIVWQKMYLRKNTFETRKHSSKMRTTTRCQYLPLGITTPIPTSPQVYLSPGYTYLPGHLLPGYTYPHSIPVPWKGPGTRDTSPQTDTHLMKTLPSPTSLADGKKVLLACFTSMNGSAASNRKWSVPYA